MKRTLLVVLAMAAGCAVQEQAVDPTPAEPTPTEQSEPSPAPDLDALEDELRAHLEGRDLGLYVVGIEAGGGNRVRVLTQLDPSQTTEAEAICNTTNVAAYGLDGMEVSGVDVAAAGGRNIAACEPRV